MSDDHHRWRTLDELFGEAVRRTGSEETAFLDRACAGQPALRASVERMLWADKAAGAFLESPVSAPGVTAEDEADDIGLVLGPYRLVELIAEGGMGAVYRAERADEAFERAVAIKMVRRRIMGAEDLQRFRTERAVLARLDHPNIARLLDGGTTGDGRPFLVMELVDGLPIDRYCAENGLELRTVIKLFQQVCAAIEYAHQNLLIHRDLKPDNILVTSDGTVKVLDFGIAKLLAPESLRLDAPVTRTGVRPMTPGYASPEQIRGLPATTRSEVFVLGALLYELLAGRSPFMAEGALAYEIESAICRIDGLPEGLDRGAKPIRDDGARALRGDPGSIIGKALRSDPMQRYGSVEQLSDDLTRWAEHRPVRARPDRLQYRLRTFVRRHRALVSVAVLLLSFAVAMMLLAIETIREQDRAQREQAKAEQVSRFMVGLFKVADPELNPGATMTVEEILERGAERIDAELVDQPLVQATLCQTVGEVYHSLGVHDRAAYFLKRALELRRGELGNSHLEVAESLSSLADVLNEGKDLATAEELQREALAIRLAALGPEAPGVAESLADLSEILSRKGKSEEALLVAHRSLVIRRRAFGDGALAVARSLAILASAQSHIRQDAQAVANFREALAIGRQHLPLSDYFLRTAQKNLAVVLKRQGDLDEAESIYRQLLASERSIFGQEHPQIGFTLSGLGTVLFEQGDYPAAGEVLNEALSLRRKLLGHDHPAVMVILTNLAELAAAQGDLDAAERLYRESLAGVRKHLGANDAVIAFPLVGLGRVMLEQGVARESATLLREALALRRQNLPEESVLVAQAEGQLGRSLVALGELDEAEPLLVASYRKLKARDTPPAVGWRATLSALVELYRALERPREVARYRRLLADAE